jgi:hypothetical protein
MSVGRSVQYTSKDQVLSAYETFEIPSWSIRNGNQLLWKYSGDDIAAGEQLLDRVLNDLVKAKSIGIYTLCLYEEAGEIKLKTEYDLSFNFRFQSESENYVSGLGGSPSAVLEEIRLMRKEIEELRAEREEEDDAPENGPLGSIGELLKNPEVMALLGKIFNSTPGQVPAQLSGITADDEEKKIQQAIPVLKIHDPKLGSHLLKLAELAEKNSVKFKTMISILDSM